MARPTKHKKRYESSGRPSKMTPAVITKLEEYFMKGLTDEQACHMADISTTSLFRYMEKNPGFRTRKEALKARPDIKAQIKVVDSIDANVGVAQWWLTKKVVGFSETLKVDATVVHEISLSPAMEAAAEAYRLARRAEIINNIKEIPA